MATATFTMLVRPAAAVHVAGAQDGTGAVAVTSVTTQVVEAVVIELSNGTQLLVRPL